MSSRIPELDLPLAALRHWPHAEASVAVHHQGVWVEPDGQPLLDFPPPALAPQAVSAPIAPAWRDFARRLAAEWFERGCQLDSDRATYAGRDRRLRARARADPGCADAHCNLGSIYFNQSRRDAARASYERALALDADHLEAHLNLATLLEEDGQRRGGAAALPARARADPVVPDAHVILALLYERLGLPRKARGALAPLPPARAERHLGRARPRAGSERS